MTTAILMAEIAVGHALIQNIARIVNVSGNTMEKLKTMLSLPMAFAKMTLIMNNAIMTALIAAQGPVIGTIALNVIVKVVFQSISFNYTFPDCILNSDILKNKLGR